MRKSSGSLENHSSFGEEKKRQTPASQKGYVSVNNILSEKEKVEFKEQEKKIQTGFKQFSAY